MGTRIFTEDLEIARRLIERDAEFTREFFYVKCYPLFKSIYDNYYTDCTSCLEFINQMYVVVLAPSKKTGRCQMENYRGESTIFYWLKSACLFHCFQKFKKKIPSERETESASDRKKEKERSLEPVVESLDRSDAEYLVGQITPPRSSLLMKLRYLDHHTNKETAKILGMTMKNYYNKHKLAKDQLARIIEREERYGK